MLDRSTARGGGKRPRVVILGKYYFPHQGGTEEYSRICASALNADYDVHVVCFSEQLKTTYEVIDGINVVRCGRLAELMSQPISTAMVRELKRLKPDLVLYNAPNYVGALAIAVAARHAKIIVIHHSDVFGRKLARDMLHPLHLSVLRRSSAVVVNSLRNVKSAVDLPAEDIRVVSIPLGMRESDYEVNEDVLQEAAELRQKVAARYIAGFIGRHVRYKGLNLIIEAIAKTEDVGCLIVGDGPKRAEAEQLVDKLNLRDRVLFLGSVDHHQKLVALQAMDVVLLPSIDKAEAFGLVQIEGQLMEKPVIVSDLPTGVQDITVHGISGLMVKTGDVDSLADALKQLAGDPEASRQMGLEGRKIALEKFTESVFGRHLCALVTHVLDDEPLRETDATLRSVKALG